MHGEKTLISATCSVAPQRRSSEQSLLQALFNSSTEDIISSFIELGYSAYRIALPLPQGKVNAV